jgi:hypothetical protein
MSARGTDPPACHLEDTTHTSALLVREIARRLSTLLNDLLAKANTFAANEDPRAGNQPLDLVLLLATERAARHRGFLGLFALSPHRLRFLSLAKKYTHSYYTQQSRFRSNCN